MDHNRTVSRGWVGSLKPYLEKPVLANLLLGWASGAPLTIALSMIGYWLAFEGVEKSTIGLFAFASTPYVLKPFWAPLLDRVRLGSITKRLGFRRGWLLTIQVLLIAALFGISTTDPAVNALETAMFVLIITTLSASQDVVVDAYRLELMDETQYGHGAAAYTVGYRAANLVVGATMLAAASYYDWSLIFAGASIFFIPAMLGLVFWLYEPEKKTSGFANAEEAAYRKKLERAGVSGWRASISASVYNSIILPLKEFISRRGWLLLLLFIVLFKLTDVLITFMTAPFLVELKFTGAELATANKVVGGIMLWLGIFFGASFYHRFGLYKTLMVTAIAMMTTNLLFIWLGWMGHNVYALGFVVGAENFASSLGNVAVVVFLSNLTSKEYTATQYALFSALAGIGRMVFGGTTGFVVEAVGWNALFIISAIAAIPSILLLWVLHKRRLGGLSDHPPSAATNPS